jgi:DNA/RNA endonuclease G (NUC1)
VAGFPRQDPPDASTYFICKPGVFAVNYFPAHRTPQWAVQHLRAVDLEASAGPAARTDKDDARVDPELPVRRSAAMNDFKDTGYVRAFLASPSSYPFNDVAYSRAQYLSNAIPVHPDRIRAWEGLSALALTAARQRGSLHVISGTIYEDGPGNGFIGVADGSTGDKGKIKVPSFLFKVLIDSKTGEYIAFLMPDGPLAAGEPAVTITTWERIESLSGLVLTPDASAAFLRQQASAPDPARWKP